MTTPSKGRSFTTAGVQYAMDKQAARWGMPAGYYRVIGADSGRFTVYGGPIAGALPAKDYRVSVILFGGRVKHERVVTFALKPGQTRPVFWTVQRDEALSAK